MSADEGASCRVCDADGADPRRIVANASGLLRRLEVAYRRASEYPTGVRNNRGRIPAFTIPEPSTFALVATGPLALTLALGEGPLRAHPLAPPAIIGPSGPPFVAGRMSNVTEILSRINSGDPVAAEQLLPLVYDELRKLAAARLAKEQPGQTLSATALVHEAWLRVVGTDNNGWDGRGHFFAAAAEAMRRILVDSARRKQFHKHGGGWVRQWVAPDELPVTNQTDPWEVLAVHEALERLARKSPRTAELVKLRYFLGCTISEAAGILGIATATAEEEWTYAKAWLRREWLRGEKNS